MNNNILSLKKSSINIESQKSFYIEKLSLKNFRNHENLNLNLENTSILIYGGNGCGKTNILEAISLLSQGKGLRKANIENFLNQCFYNSLLIALLISSLKSKYKTHTEFIT